jgi:60 kDa SS-A/Ro ribonucleoprotein
MAHPKPATKAQAVLFHWAVEGALGRVPAGLLEDELKPIHAYELARKAADKQALVSLIEDYQLTQEMIPQHWLSAREVWEALLDSMPYCAMLRNLGRLTAVGLIAPQGETTALVAARLVDHRRIERARVHPVTLLRALLAYRERHGGGAIGAALEEAYYASFTNVTPAGRRIGLKLDASALIPSAAMAMLSARTEPGDAGKRHDRLDAVMDAIRAAPTAGPAFGVEGLVVVTAERKWTPPDRPAGVPLVVIAPHATAPPVAPADDPWMLQVVGFNATVPPVVADFFRAM